MIAFFASCSRRERTTGSRSSRAASNSRLQITNEAAEEEEVAFSFIILSIPNRALPDTTGHCEMRVTGCWRWSLRIRCSLIYNRFASAEINRVFTVVTAGNPRFEPPAQLLGKRSQARLRSSPPIDHYFLLIPVSTSDLDGTPRVESFREINRRNIRITGRVSAMVVVQCPEQFQ